jgi:hypothetical protein
MTKELPVPKYKIGDKVWLGTAQSTEGTHPCPDCFGSGKWAVKSPAGLETTVPCPRCSHNGYFNSDAKVPSLEYLKYVAVTHALTIGSITAKTHPWHDDDGVEYMCNETGIGSGSIYREGRLHATEAEAFEYANREVAEAQARVDEKPESLKKYHFSSFTCDLTAYHMSWESLYQAWDSARDYREIVDRIAEGGNKITLDDVEDLLACREDKPWRRKHPLAAVLEAIKAGDIVAARAAYDAIPKPAIVPASAEAEAS